MRYFKQQIMKFNAIKGDFTSKNLPKINPLKLKEMERELLYKINQIPPYYIMYQGRDKSVALKDSVLSPEYPKD